jgi:arylsulfatase A-like enzyme
MKLLVLIVRGLQAGAVGPYGNRWIDTPTLDAMAAGGVVFDWSLAAHPDRGGAARAWRTGCYHFPQTAELIGPCPDLLAVLTANNVTMHLILDAAREDDFLAGWSSVQVAEGMKSALAAARQAVEGLPPDGSGLVWVELSALLPPWRIPERFVEPYFTAADTEEEDEDEEEDESPEEEPGEEEEEPPLEPIFAPKPGAIEEDDDVILSIQTTYAAAVTWVDSSLAGLLGALPDDVAVLLTADHGQALGEHLVVGPVRPWLHEELVHVPLLMYGPGWRAGHRVAGLTQSVDLAPTLAELFGARLENAHGRSLLPLLGLEDRALRDYACMGLQVSEQAQWGLRTPNWSLLLPLEAGAEPLLYVKPDDRCEVNNVAQHHLEQADALAKTLRAFVAATSAPGPLVPPPLL